METPWRKSADVRSVSRSPFRSLYNKHRRTDHALTIEETAVGGGATMSRYGGMTIRERLFDAKLLDTWDQAIRNEDRQAMISMLLSVDLDPHEAAATADAVLRNRFLNDLRGRLDAMSLTQLGEVYTALLNRTADLSIGAASLKELILTEIHLSTPRQ